MNEQRAPERLDKILSGAGFGSRSDAKMLIRSGAVICDGIVVKAPEKKYIAEIIDIEVNGAAINYRRRVYLMMHKPGGVICATYDPHHTTVIDLLPDSYRNRNLFPVGRLDIDTTGLLLITDDGDLAHRLLSPKKHVEKEYEAVLDKHPGAEVIEGFERGVNLGGGVRLRPAKLVISETDDTDDNANKSHKMRVIITEGKYHQVKRMFLAYGINVLELKRVRIGSLCLDPSLAPGEHRILANNEISLIS